MKPDDRYESYAEWEDDSERVEKIRRSPKEKGMIAKGFESSPRASSVKKNKLYRRPDKF